MPCQHILHEKAVWPAWEIWHMTINLWTFYQRCSSEPSHPFLLTWPHIVLSMWLIGCYKLKTAFWRKTMNLHRLAWTVIATWRVSNKTHHKLDDNRSVYKCDLINYMRTRCIDISLKCTQRSWNTTIKFKGKIFSTDLQEFITTVH